jgi:hypothetical protein
LRLPKRALRLLSSPSSFFLLRKPIFAVWLWSVGIERSRGLLRRLRLNNGCGVSCRSLGQQPRSVLRNRGRRWMNVSSWWKSRPQAKVYESRRRVAGCLKGSGVSQSMFRKGAQRTLTPP